MNNSRCLQFAASVALATTSVLSGFSPDRLMSQQFLTQNSRSQAAYAQESSFTRYVRAVFEIEQKRRSLISQVKGMTGRDLPDNVCDSGFSRLQGQFQEPVRDICNRFNNEASRIVNKHNVSGEFNGFQQQAMSNDRKVKREMQKRISDEMRRLRLI
jgi:Domain of unknown function (DUF4168)